jgi:hypothetical protein
VGGDIVEIERVGIRLIGKSGAMANNNDKATGA